MNLGDMAADDASALLGALLDEAHGRLGERVLVERVLGVGRRVVGLGTWSIRDPKGRETALLPARDPEHAVQLALEAPR